MSGTQLFPSLGLRRPIASLGPWTLLYVMIAVAGWRTFVRGPPVGPTTVWTIALVLNFAWSPIFLSIAHPADCIVCGCWFVRREHSIHRVVMAAGRNICIPIRTYAAWVFFATILNGAIWRLNS